MKEYIVSITDDEDMDEFERNHETSDVLIRCGECKYFDSDSRFCHHLGWGDGHANYMPPIKEESGFCDWAENKPFSEPYPSDEELERKKALKESDRKLKEAIDTSEYWANSGKGKYYIGTHRK
jgi:hypothetical protein